MNTEINKVNKPVKRFHKRFLNRTLSILLVELGLTFIGVLSALGVENLREVQLNKTLEREYLVAFHDALQSDTATINTELERCFLKLNAASQFLELITTDDTIPEGQFEMAVQYILMHIDPAFNTAIFEDLKFSGNMRIMRNGGLRNDLISHYTYLNKIITLQSSAISTISYNHHFSDQLKYDEFILSGKLPQQEIIERFRKNKESQLYLHQLQKQMVVYRNSLIYSTLPKTLILLDKVTAELNAK